MNTDASGPATMRAAVHVWEDDGGQRVQDQQPDQTGCMACGHSPEGHDKIAQRFCDATVERALTRGCICRVA